MTAPPSAPQPASSQPPSSQPDCSQQQSSQQQSSKAAPQQGLPHDFEVQKELHRRIRNDPDYDDWEYGTEPLPHEGWVQASRAGCRDGDLSAADPGA
ncbi:MAG: hypothetical protein AAFX65_10995 [Cyanobacteria bacterium J06638_7]